MHFANERINFLGNKVIDVEVVYALPDTQYLLTVKILPNSTVEDAIQASGILTQCPEIDLQNNKVGIFGKIVGLEKRLHPGDRVEIYRALLLDPMQARKLRAKASPLKKRKERRVKTWPLIEKNALVDVIAPSGKIDPDNIATIHDYLENLGLRSRIPEALLGDHPFCANDDDIRFEHLKNALYADDSELIWCVRGGHGTTRLLPRLLALTPPKKPKLLVGFSDITALHLFLNQVWQWPSLHAPMARLVACGLSDKSDVSALHSLWFEGLTGYTLNDIEPMNDAAKKVELLTGLTAGTSLSLIQTSLGTPWQIDSRNKIIILEDINELPYRLDRLFVHLTNAHVFDDAKALILGDMGEDTDTNQTEQIKWVLKDFVNHYLPQFNATLPVYRIQGVGHGKRNQPVPLGVKGRLHHDARGWKLSY